MSLLLYNVNYSKTDPEALSVSIVLSAVDVDIMSTSTSTMVGEEALIGVQKKSLQMMSYRPWKSQQGATSKAPSVPARSPQDLRYIFHPGQKPKPILPNFPFIFPKIVCTQTRTKMLLFALSIPSAKTDAPHPATATSKPPPVRKRARTKLIPPTPPPSSVEGVDAAINAGALSVLPGLISRDLPTLSYASIHRAMTALSKAGLWHAVLDVFELAAASPIRGKFTARIYTDFFLATMKLGGRANAYKAYYEWVRVVHAGEEGRLIGPRSYNFLFVQLSRAALVDEAAEVRTKCFLNGYYLNRYSYNAFLSACAKTHRFDDAFTTLRQMAERGVSPDVVSFNVLISCCVKSGDVDVALNILSRMRDWDITPDIYSYNSVVNGLRKNKMLDEAFELVAQMERDCDEGGIVGNEVGVSPDLVTYNTLLSGIAATESPDFERAMRVKRHMESRGLSCNEVTYNALMASAAKSEMLDQAFEIYDEMIAGSYKPNCECFTTLITLCGRAQLADKAFQIHDHMIASGIKPNVITFNALLTACRRADEDSGETALQILRVMRKTEGCEPDVITYSTVIDALGRAGRFDEMQDVLSEMTTHGIPPNLVTYTSMIAALTRAGDIVSALEVLQDMEENDVEPNVYTFSSLINGAAKKGDFKMALEMLSLMYSRGIQASRITYAMLFQLALRLGRADHLAKVLEELGQDERVNKECLEKVRKLCEEVTLVGRNRVVNEICKVLETRLLDG